SLLSPSPRSTLFPYTTLFRSVFQAEWAHDVGEQLQSQEKKWRNVQMHGSQVSVSPGRIRMGTSGLLLGKSEVVTLLLSRRLGQRDRKSTRLNSSHDQISYAVF